MKIACLGWGSLVWDPRELPVQEKWFEDGPFLPIEFARQSKDGRLNLVIVPNYETKVRSLWALFSVNSVSEAQEALGKREGITKKENIKDYIAVWTNGTDKESDSSDIAMWAQNLGLEAVLWTALLPKFDNRNSRVPTIGEAIAYLRDLPHEQRRNAERYIRMTPRQVDTPYRRRFEVEFGWTPLSTI